jgi:DNA-binding SARP family transcriptional activator
VSTWADAVIPAKIRAPVVRGLVRPRLHDLILRHLREHRLALVIAPAGSGKTTLLVQCASRVDVPVAWFRAEHSDGDARSVLAYVEAALTTALPELAPLGGWQTVGDAARAMEAHLPRSVMLVVDDLHTLQGTPGEALLGQLIDYAPRGLTILAASRRAPAFNLPRLRLSGDLLEMGADDVRFRTWEVERLFRDFYEQPLPPEDLAQLARRTEGWAAGLQLFHLATHRKAAEARRRTLAALTTGTRLVREYLARNVVDELPGELRSFLLSTCVLGRLSGRICDAFLGRTGSARLLSELESRQIFTQLLDERGCYRYHEVLRSHLESVLAEEIGEAGVRARYLEAARHLEGDGALPEALHAYCRGDDWDAVARILGRLGPGGEQVDLAQGAWLDELPADFREQDPWVLLATARRHRAAGQWQAALEAYRKAEDAFGTFGGGELAQACRRERLALRSWQEPAPFLQPDWQGVVRAASIREPLAAGERASQLPGPSGRLAAGLCALLGGHLREARTLLTAAIESPGAGGHLAAGARLALGVAALLMGDSAGRTEVELAAEDADRLGVAWLVRMSHAALALTDRADGLFEAASAREASERNQDPWGASLAGLFEGLGALLAGLDRRAVLEQAAAGFRALGAATLEAWCRCAKALMAATSGDPEALVEAAEVFARSAAVRGPLAFAYLALGDHRDHGGIDGRDVLGDDEPDEPSPVEAIRLESGLWLPPAAIPASPASAAAANGSGRTGKPERGTWQVRCFGGFELSVDGHVIDLSALKPRPLQLLRLLAIQGGRLVHREVLIETLWHGVHGETGARHLHVAVSSLRHALGSASAVAELESCGNAGDAGKFVERSGDAYRLALPPDAEHDIVDFERWFSVGRAERRAGNVRRAMAAFRKVLEIHRGDLLPEDGPAEWVATERETYRAQTAEAAHSLAEFLVRFDDAAGAARCCEWGLRFDRYNDALWRLLVHVHARAGDAASAARARNRYDAVLDELGVSSASA